MGVNLVVESLRALTNLIVMQAHQRGGATRTAPSTPWAWTTTAAAGRPRSAIVSPTGIRTAGAFAWATFDGVQRSLRFVQQHTQGAAMLNECQYSTVP